MSNQDSQDQPAACNNRRVHFTRLALPPAGMMGT